MPGALQVHTAENAFLIHHANAYEEGDETIVLSSGWVRPGCRLELAVLQCKRKHATRFSGYGTPVSRCGYRSTHLIANTGRRSCACLSRACLPSAHVCP